MHAMTVKAEYVGQNANMTDASMHKSQMMLMLSADNVDMPCLQEQSIRVNCTTLPVLPSKPHPVPTFIFACTAI